MIALGAGAEPERYLPDAHAEVFAKKSTQTCPPKPDTGKTPGETGHT